ncbi:Disease resistance protein [Parasponia andersonii]|uniref:Disease resistance protein n=1 Tax=Parasponia andersonii TaxID=3476 RepID=A0A2P5CK77_PARAD|nr:Disease resistance protein [Parasponia andersonii]
MDSSGGGGCCRCCFSFIFTMGLTALFMWLSLRTSNPTCSIQDIYFPALNKTLNNPKNTTVYLSLRLDNGNKDKGVHYDTVNLNLSYVPNVSDPHRNSLIDNYTNPAFYQGHKKKANKPVNFSAETLNWTEVRGLLSTSKTVFFRVDLATAVRFKIMAWNTKRHKLMVGANVEVNDLGVKVQKKGVKLTNKGTKIGLCSLQVGILANLLIWVVLNFW